MGTTGNHETIVDLIPAYALSSLEAAEAAQVAAHLEHCPACQELLASYVDVVSALPLAATEKSPAPELKTQLLARIHETPESTTAVAPSPAIEPTSLRLKLQHVFSGSVWRPMALGLGVLALILGFVLWQQLNYTNSIRFDQFVMSNTEAAPEATGLIIMGEDGKFGTLVVDRLPILDEDQQYQLWLVKDGKRVSGGVFSVYEGGYQSIKIKAPDPLASYTSFGITIEPSGGSDNPTGERVLGFNL